MLLKEKGYDEFLAEEIRLGREEAKAGLGYTLEESMRMSKEALERKIREIEQANLSEEMSVYA